MKPALAMAFRFELVTAVGVDSVCQQEQVREGIGKSNRLRA